MLDAGDGAARERLAVHDAGIERQPAERSARLPKPTESDGEIVFDRRGPGERRIEDRLAGRELLHAVFDGDFAEGPGGDDDGFGHGSGSSGVPAIVAGWEFEKHAFAFLRTPPCCDQVGDLTDAKY